MDGLIAEEEGTDLGGWKAVPGVITIHFLVLFFVLLIQLDHRLLESWHLVPKKGSNGALRGKWPPCFVVNFKSRAALCRIQNNPIRRLFQVS